MKFMRIGFERNSIMGKPLLNESREGMSTGDLNHQARD